MSSKRDKTNVNDFEALDRLAHGVTPAKLRPMTPLTRHAARMKYPRRPFMVVQPDYRKWEKVRGGMTRAEVVQLLGEPIEKYRGTRTFPDVVFGFLDFSFLPVPK